MIISVIVAIAKNLAIGKNNDLLCYIPGDLKRFKNLTTNHTVVMGRRTLASLPNGPLPNRRNLVLTSHLGTLPKDCAGFRNFEEAVRYALSKGETELFIIGGGKVYNSTLNYADRLYLTFIDASFDGDTFFPSFDWDDWNETFRENYEASEKCPYDFSFINLERKNK